MLDHSPFWKQFSKNYLKKCDEGKSHDEADRVGNAGSYAHMNEREERTEAADASPGSPTIPRHSPVIVTPS